MVGLYYIIRIRTFANLRYIDFNISYTGVIADILQSSLGGCFWSKIFSTTMNKPRIIRSTGGDDDDHNYRTRTTKY